MDGVLAGEPGGAPEWLAVRLGRRRTVLVPARDAVEAGDRLWVPYAGELIRAAPKAGAEASLSVADERALLGHYGVAADAGRAAELSGRDDAAISARPA